MVIIIVCGGNRLQYHHYLSTISIYCARGLLIEFQDVAFLPSLASFSTTCKENCGRGESLGITTCLKTVVGGKQGHAPCKVLLLHITSFFVS